MFNQNKRHAIDAALWRAFDVLAGVSNLNDANDYILAMLTLKFITDIGECKGDEGSKYLNLLVVPEGNGFLALYGNNDHKKNIGQHIDDLLNQIELKNPQLSGISSSISFNSISLGSNEQKDRILSELLSVFNVDVFNFLEAPDIAEQTAAYACDALIRIAAERSGKYGGDFFTPSHVTELMARLMKPKADEFVGDPCCGSGSMLIACSDYARKKDGQGCFLFGQEKNGKTLALAKMNMALHGEIQARLEWGDTLSHPKILVGSSLQKFDIAVSNPPFALRDWGHEDAGHDPYNRYHRAIPPRGMADYAFISHMVATLKEETGRMAVVVSHGVLFRGGTEGKIRKSLVDENLIDAVIALPVKTFSYAAIPVVILVLRKTKADKNVLFIDASKDFQYGKTQNVLREQEVKRIEEACEQRVSEEGYAQLVTCEQIAANDYNLSVARYIELEEETEEVDLAALQAERAQLRTELAGLESKLTALLKEVGHG